MINRLRRRGRGAGEEGSALVLALLFLSVCAVTTGGLLKFANAGSTTAAALKVTRSSDYDAVSAMNAAIANVRLGNTCGSGASGYTPTWTLNNTSQPLRVDCVNVAPPIFDSTTSPLPDSMPSMAYAARSTSEVGDEISFADLMRRLSSVTVTMEDFAQHATYPTWPTASWQWPITLNMYTVNTSGCASAPGQLIVSQTQTATIAWKPATDPTCTPSGYYRAADGTCASSLPVNITWNLSSLAVDLPSQVIVSVEFNTESNGPAPTGVDGPYDLLNIAFSSSPSIGSNVEPDALFYNSTYAGFYADGGAGGVGVFRRDTGWTPYTPAIQVVATDIPTQLKRYDVFSVCPTSASAPCPSSKSLLNAYVTFYDGQSVGQYLVVNTWSNS